MAASRPRPPIVLLASGAALLFAIVAFVLGFWQAGVGGLVFHWLLGAVAILKRRRPPLPSGSRDR